MFKTKYNAQGNIESYKARLVARGFTQEYGKDYLETYAPVARLSSIRYLFALAVKYDLNVDYLDVETAFLNGNLNEEIYIKQPEGFIVKGQEEKVCLLKKAMYGLNKAADVGM